MTETRKCSRCGAVLPADARGGHCLPCLLQLGLQSTETAGSDVAAGVPPAGEGGILPPGPSLAEKPGDRIGHYKLLQQIGEGGCGVVYMAEQEQPVRRRVALKIIKLGMDTRNVIARFEAERQALAMMDHPNIAKVFDAGATSAPVAADVSPAVEPGFQPGGKERDDTEAHRKSPAIPGGKMPPSTAGGTPAATLSAGRPYFVMELVRGVKITTYCDQQKLSTRQRLDLFIQVCLAVQHAHQKGIIHRDLKPSNILVTEQDGAPVPKIIDFGIAKATTDQRLTDKTLFTAFEQFIGTPAYMSPEQAGLGGLDIDTRSDIYSLGVLLYELLTGHPPFDAEQLARSALHEILRVIRENEPPRPSARLTTLTEQELTTVAQRHQIESTKLPNLLRGDLDWIVMKALEKDRTRRYETANGLAADIQRHLSNEPVVACPPTYLYRLQKSVRRNKLVFAFGTALGLILTMGAIVSTWYAVKATRAEREKASLLEKTQAAKAEETRQRMAAEDNFIRIEIQKAQELFAADDTTSALAYLADVLRRNPANRVAANRLLSALTYRSFSLPLVVLHHNDQVRSAQFSPDGQRVVTASDDNSAQIWEVNSGRPLTGPLTHDGPIQDAEFSPDGEMVVTASVDKSARVWSTRTGKMLTRPLIHDDKLNGAHFSPDGTLIITASRDKTARIWNAANGQLTIAPILHEGEVLTAEFSPDGKRIVTGCRDNTARVFDALTGRELIQTAKHDVAYPNGVWYASFSPDGLRIATGANDGTVRIWDARTGDSLAAILAFPGSGKFVASLAFSPGGERIAASSYDMTARVWDTITLAGPTKPLKHHGIVYSVSFSPDGLRLITASEDKTARIWDARTGEPLTSALRHKSEVKSASFSPDNCLAVTASKDNTAVVWEVRPGQTLDEPLTHPGVVACARFSFDGRRIATACWDGTARIWDARTSRLLIGPLNRGSRSVEFSPDGEYLLTRVLGFPGAFVWDVQTGRLIASLEKDFTSVCFSPDSLRVLTTCYSNAAQIWDARTGKQLVEAIVHKPGRVTSGCFSPDGKRVVTTSNDRTAVIWDALTGRPVTKALEHQAFVLCCSFSPEGHRVVTGSGDCTARVWNAQTGEPLTGPLNHDSRVSSARFSPDGERILTASSDKTARLWDAHTGRPLGQPMQHDERVTAAEFSLDGSRVATASEDGTAQVWDAWSGEPLTERLKHDRPVIFVEFSPDGQRVLTSSMDGTARIWEVPPAPTPVPPWLPMLAETLGGQRLNQQGAPETIATAEILKLKEQIFAGSSSEFYTQWAKWFFADRNVRTISPSSSVTMRDYVQRRVEEDNLGSLNQAVRLAPTNGLALARFVMQILASPAYDTQHVAQVSQLSKRALALSPDEPEAWLARMKALESSGSLDAAFIREFVARQPQNPDAWKAIGLFWEKADRLDEAFQAYSNAIELSQQRTNLTELRRAEYLLARANFFKRKNRFAEAAADHLKAFNIRPRDPAAKPELIDLSLAYNVNFAEDWEDWGKVPGDGLSLLPGVHTLAGVEFDVRGVIQVFASQGAGTAYPTNVSDMAVGRRCKTFHFLHAAISVPGTANGQKIGSYVIHYQDGQQKEVPLRFGAELTDWFSGPAFSATSATVAWTGSSKRSARQECGLQLFHYAWENPLPDIEVRSIELVSNGTTAGPFLVALTVQ